ncbi:MAG: hypothetical protein RI897_3277 [Verrucomicrobiota bacterium]
MPTRTLLSLALAGSLFTTAFPEPAPSGTPQPQNHFQSGSEQDWTDWLDLDHHFQTLQKERAGEHWFAALTSLKPGSKAAIHRRFKTPSDFNNFLSNVSPLVEVWTRTATEQNGSLIAQERRLTALELAQLIPNYPNLPTWITVTFPTETNVVDSYKVEFSLHAAQLAHDNLLALAQQQTQIHRIREILATRDAKGHVNASAQWDALHQAIIQGEILLQHAPPPPTSPQDPFVAYEFAVDSQARFRGFDRVYRESEIQKDLRGGRQQLLLKPAWTTESRIALAFSFHLPSNSLQPCVNPLPGRDTVELRVAQTGNNNPATWNVLEFAEPEILRNSALAQFGLINASLEKQRKHLAWKKNTIDLYVEPAIAAANIGGGIAGAGFPFGEALRLAYNLTVTPQLMADVPTVEELRNLFLLLAAKKNDPKLANKAAEWLTTEDLAYLQQQIKLLPEDTIQAAAESVSDDDIKAMLSLARMQGWDARYRLFVDIVSSAARTAGVSNGTFIGQMFNNPYFALNGDVSIKNVLAAMIGEKTLIYPNGGSMEDLIAGGGMPKEWLQFFDVTVDARAIANTLHRLRTTDLADRELRQPFPYAPRLDNLAAYEIRAFGFPLLLYYKRGLMRDDLAAYESTYAYTVLGSEVVEHFPTREDFERQIRNRQVVPLGYVKVRDANGRLSDSNLAVFARIFPKDQHRGKTGIVLYGMQAFEEYSALVERERQRFFDYEKLLQQGGVIERVVQANDEDRLPSTTFEPVIHLGDAPREQLFIQPLSALRELQRYHQLLAWHQPLSPSDTNLAAHLKDTLKPQGIHTGNVNEAPFLLVDRYGTTFQFRQKVNSAWRTIERTIVHPPQNLPQALQSSRLAREIAEARRQNFSAKSGSLVLLNSSVQLENATLIGPPLLHPETKALQGSGLLTTPSELASFWTAIETLPPQQKANLHQGRFAGLPVQLNPHTNTVFVTVEYPLTPETLSIRQQPGRPTQHLHYKHGLLTEIITTNTITTIHYSPYQQETNSLTHQNIGSLQAPAKGRLLQQTWTLDAYLYPPLQPPANPGLPRLRKLRQDLVLGTLTLETYGSFDLPVETISTAWITRNNFDTHGNLLTSTIHPNLQITTSPPRSQLNQILQPLPGPQRFLLQPALPHLTSQPWKNLFPSTPPDPSTDILLQTDLLLNTTNIVFHDRAALGRKTGSLEIDPFDGSRFFASRTTNYYQPDFHEGLIPTKTERIDASSGTLLASTRILSFNAESHETVGQETDAEGFTRQLTWRDGHPLPSSTQTPQRKTTTTINPADPLTFSGNTTDRTTGEELASFTGYFDKTSQTWLTTQTVWHRPTQTNRIESIRTSIGGRTISTTTSHQLETLHSYTPTGLPSTNSTWWIQPQARTLLRQEYPASSNKPGHRHVITYLENQPHDRYQIQRDINGRIQQNAIHLLPSLQFWSNLEYDHGSDRILRAQEFQNNQLRLTRISLPETTTNGITLQPVLIQPAWGQTSTQWFSLNDPWGRPQNTTHNDGRQTTVQEWFPGSAIPKTIQELNPAGIVESIISLQPHAGTHNDIPYDLLSHVRVGPNGQGGPSYAEAQAIGTGLPLFRDAAGRRLLLNPASTYESPIAAVDPHGQRGVSLVVDQSPLNNVLAVLLTRTNQIPARPNSAAEPGLEQTEVDLESPFFHRVIRRQLDAAGKLLSESTSRIPAPTEIPTRLSLLDAASQSTPLRIFEYNYLPGWIVEQGGYDQTPRQWAFVTQQPSPHLTSWPVNQNRQRNFVSGVEGWRNRPGTQTTVQPHTPNSWLFRTLLHPAISTTNPYLPGLQNLWTTWTSTELDPDGQPIHNSKVIYDARGQLRLTQTRKQSTTPSQTGIRTAYVLADESLHLQPAHAPGSELLATSPVNWEDSDFICWQVTTPTITNLHLTLTDAQGQQLNVRHSPSRPQNGDLAFWIPNPAQQLWLPNSDEPAQVSSVTTTPGQNNHTSWLTVAVAELQAAGLDITRIASAQLHGQSTETRNTLASHPLRLRRLAPFTPLEKLQPAGRTLEPNSNGLLLARESTLNHPDDIDVTGQKSSATILLNQQELARTLPPTHPSPYPTLLFIDSSDGESPRPLYALSSRDGHFLKHYLKEEHEDAIQLYTVVSGFDTPLMEVFQRNSLSDEFSPGFIAYGYDYHASVVLQRDSGWLGRSLARLINRISANPFNYYGHQLGTNLWSDLRQKQNAPLYRHQQLHLADTQAQTIRQLPSLAQALLAYREPPLSNSDDDSETGLLLNHLGLRLLQLQTQSFPTNQTPFFEPTYLIPTYPNTAAHSTVDTTAETEIILLAIRLGEYDLAGELLEFYRRKTHEGQDPVHAAYDATTGAAMAREFGPEHAMQAQLTAAAQLGLTEAALQLAIQTQNPTWLRFGQNLLHVLTETYLSDSDLPGPHGLTQYRAHPALAIFGIQLWPESDRYPVGLNARFYLLLQNLVRNGATAGASPQWLASCQSLLNEQRLWLQQYVLPEVDRTGVVPSGLFEIQDIVGKTTQLAPERWSTASDWLDFLEAALALNLDTNRVSNWFDHLLRVHGSQVGPNFGLDPSLPLLRPAAITPELTARLHQLARQLGKEDVARAASSSLANLQIQNPLSPAHPNIQYASFPALTTTAPARNPLPLGQGNAAFPQTNLTSWPDDYRPFRHLITQAPPSTATAESLSQADPLQLNDLRIFSFITISFYLLILVVALLWWRFRQLRPSRSPGHKDVDERLLAEESIRLAEERWAHHILGVQTPANAPHTRFSNATLEQNFLMQLRALYKIIVEWRRMENGWNPADPRLANDQSDPWLNGLDEFASCLGIYFRHVIKTGHKDGLRQKDALDEAEDSNHIWSRLVMYLAEPYLGMVTLLRQYNNVADYRNRQSLNQEIQTLLQDLGVRQRPAGFDARVLFNYPANPEAFDLLKIQKPGARLKPLLQEAAAKLQTPFSHLAGIIEKYKQFKHRERPLPIHPYIIEFAKTLPHFLLMGLGALVVYNQQTLADSPIIPYLWFSIASLFQSADTLLWALPLGTGLALTAYAHFARVYRFEASMLPRQGGDFVLDVTVTRLMGKKHKAVPKAKSGLAWNPVPFARAGWILRIVGWLLLAQTLLSWDTPSFATFLVVKGLFAMIALAEVAAILLPLGSTFISGALQDLVIRHPHTPAPLQFLNRLNFSANRPASPIALSIRYLFQPSVPSGDTRSLALAILSYFGLAAAFFFVGVYLCQGILALWFTENYLNASYVKLIFGGLVFWNTMYLLRYGLFLLTTAVTSLLCSYPFRTLAALGGLGFITLAATSSNHSPQTLPSAWIVVGALALLAIFEDTLLKRSKTRDIPITPKSPAPNHPGTVNHLNPPANAKAGIVYMSGDDLGSLKLTADLLMTRWQILRDKLGSTSAKLASQLGQWPDDTALRQAFEELYNLESHHDITLWHPCQLVTKDQPAPAHLKNLTLTAKSSEHRQQLLRTWQIRRWIVTMMSTAGHSQDTAINLVDMALRFETDQIAPKTAFFLIANKYDNREDNRPVQLNYDQGELQQREKLCQLLEALAPGTHAYNIQNWTPFGFKAGGMTGMDLVPEENLQLTTMVVLDRNATINDMDNFMADLNEALADPELVIVIPGRGTTNTLTPIGQGSQMIEEGHRSFLRGLMGLMGGNAGESLGTGWGNIVAYTYGRVQRALLDPLIARMPLTSRMQRGSSFAVRTEGLIGFSPHAVGISEDTWAVSQAAHNLVALGGRVRFRLSRAFWHKIRETWSHAEWLASFPRWSGGYLQMMQDTIMQRINDFGPLSVFARELRASSGRAYLTAPFALFNILFLPLAIILDVTPFVQILIVLWNFGFVMNQVLTLHGLNAYLQSTGFSRLGAVVGLALGGIAAVLSPALAPYATGLALLALFVGGFWEGTSRWAYTRLRDILLFGPQLILHGLGQIMRQTIEFVISGAAATDAQKVNMAFRAWAGPREDQPLNRYPHFINLHTVVWIIGLPSVALNLLALSNLDMFNVVLLLPSLLFSTSVLAGPFIMTPKPGTEPQYSPLRLLRWLGWPAAIAVMTAISMSIARGGSYLLLATIITLCTLAALLVAPGRHFGFHFRLRLLRNRLLRQLAAGGVPAQDRPLLTQQLFANAGKPDAISSALQNSPLASEAQKHIAHWIDQDLAPTLHNPKLHPVTQNHARQRITSEFRRTFSIALLICLWFVVVPVPGLFVFSAGSYALSMTLESIVYLVLALTALAIVGYWTSEILRRLRRRHTHTGLEQRAIHAFQDIQRNWNNHPDQPCADTARRAALLTDLLTYLDQKAEAYAQDCLNQIQPRQKP